MSKLRRATLMAFFLFAITGFSWAQWSVVSAAINPNPIIYTFADVSGTLTIRVRSQAANSPFFIAITGGSPEYLSPRRTFLGTDYLEYDIFDNLTNRNPILPVTDPGITASNVISGVTAGNKRATVTVPVFVPELQGGTIFPSGIYTQTIIVRLYQGNFVQGGPYTQRAERNLTVRIRLRNTFVGVQIADTGGAFGTGLSAASLDFGTLTTGESAGKDAVVKSHLSYTLGFSSLHGGSLAPASGTTANIPYVFTYEGIVRSLATPWTSPVYAALDPDLGEERNHPMIFTVGTVDPMSQSAGLYSDTLTVVITTQ